MLLPVVPQAWHLCYTEILLQKAFVKFGPARNFSRPKYWRASSVKAQFSDFAFNWLNSSLSSWSKSSHLTFGSDKLSIRQKFRLSFLTRLCTPSVVRVLVILINYTRVRFKRRWNWKTMTFKSWWYFPVLLYRFATDFDNIQNVEIISRDCSFIYRPSQRRPTMPSCHCGRFASYLGFPARFVLILVS